MRKVTIILCVLLSIVVTYFAIKLVFEDSNDKGYTREKYNKDLFVSINYKVCDKGLMDLLYERTIYITNRKSDSLEIKLHQSEYIGFLAIEDTLSENNTIKDVIIFGNIDGPLETVIDVSLMKEIENHSQKSRVLKRNTHDSAKILFNIQPLIPKK